MKTVVPQLSGQSCSSRFEIPEAVSGSPATQGVCAGPKQLSPRRQVPAHTGSGLLDGCWPLSLTSGAPFRRKLASVSVQIASAAVVGLMLFFSSTAVYAQGTAYKSRPVDKAEQAKATQIAQMLQGGNLDDASKTAVDNHLKNFFFARWTDEANAADLIRFRRDLTDIANSASGQSKAYFLAQATRYLNAMGGAKTIYPACRYNAMLALGTLDVGRGPEDRPIPYPEALPLLIKAYQNKSVGTDSANEAVRLAAMLGIERHAVLGIADENVRDNQVVPLFLQLALDTPHMSAHKGVADEIDPDAIVISTEPSATNTTEPQRTIELQDWFRMRAIQGLGVLATSKKHAEIVQSLLTIIENPNELPVIRYEAAFSLGKYDLVAAGADPAHIIDSLLALGIAVCDDGISFMAAQSSSQQLVGSSGMGMGSEMGGGTMGMGSSMGSPTGGGMGAGGDSAGQALADQINNSIARIKYGFSPILACLVGPNYKTGGLLSAGFKDEHAVLLAKDAVKSLQDCIKFLEDGDPDVAKRLREMARASGDPSGGAGQRRPARGGRNSMSSSESGMGMTGSDGMGAMADIKNAPKVTKLEIEQQMKKVRTELATLLSTSEHASPPVKPAATATPAATPAAATNR